MPSSPSPKRYAQAVFQIAVERDELDTWLGDLEVIASALEDAQFAGLLDAPQVPSGRKVDAVRQALSGSVEPLAVNLLSVLAVRNLAYLSPNVLDEYSRLLDRQGGIEQAEVVTALALDDDQRDQVGALLREVVGSEVRLSSVVEPEILGGLVAKIGDRVIDGSIRTRLAELRRELVG